MEHGQEIRSIGVLVFLTDLSLFLCFTLSNSKSISVCLDVYSSAHLLLRTAHQNGHYRSAIR